MSEAADLVQIEVNGKLTKVYLALGSNLGDRQNNLEGAVKRLAEKLVIEQTSSLYETEPIGYREQPLFLNAVCCATTELGPFDLLHLNQETERALGRVPSFPDGPRLIDIDILFYGDRVIATPQLTIPHPHLAERAFVLVPLAEIAARLVHPVLRKTVEELTARVGGQDGVRRVGSWSTQLTQRRWAEEEEACTRYRSRGTSMPPTI